MLAAEHAYNVHVVPEQLHYDCFYMHYNYTSEQINATFDIQYVTTTTKGEEAENESSSDDDDMEEADEDVRMQEAEQPS